MPVASAPTVEEPPTVVATAETASSSAIPSTTLVSASGRTRRQSSDALAKTPTYDDPANEARCKLVGDLGFDDRLAGVVEPGGTDA